MNGFNVPCVSDRADRTTDEVLDERRTARAKAVLGDTEPAAGNGRLPKDHPIDSALRAMLDALG